jgi:hypothetical protein
MFGKSGEVMTNLSWFPHRSANSTKNLPIANNCSKNHASKAFTAHQSPKTAPESGIDHPEIH